MQIGRLANVHLAEYIWPVEQFEHNCYIVLDKKHQIVSQSHLVVKTTVFFHREFEIARGTRAVSVCNFSGENIRDVRLLWHQPISEIP
jgi:hypothetical protein